MSYSLLLLAAALLLLETSLLPRLQSLGQRRKRRWLARLPWWLLLAPTLVYPPLAMVAATSVWTLRRFRSARSHRQQQQQLAEQLSIILAQVKAGAPPPPAPSAQLQPLFRVSQQRGVALAPLLESSYRSVEANLRHQQETSAALAGAKATAWTLTALPPASLLLGTAMGADPVGLLLHHPLGKVLAIVGVGLTCLGFITTQLILERAQQ